MRLRNIPNADEEIASSPFCIQSPENYRSSWHKLFQNSNPIHIEIGMGKGRFLLQMSQKHPDINYLGIEKYTSVLLRATQKLNNMHPGQIPANLHFLCIDAENLTEIFAPQEISKIYLNFSDPWPKKRHANRRLTSGKFLALYHQILNKNGCIEFKTDNRNLFDYSMEQLSVSHWQLESFTFDLHNDSKMNQNNIMTEYEEKFSSIGNPICKLIAFPPA